MPYFEFKNGVTPINDTNLNAMQASIKNETNSIFKFKKYTKEINVEGTSSVSTTMGALNVPEGYKYIGCVAGKNAIADQFLVSYSNYGDNITAMVQNLYPMALAGILECTVIFVKEEYWKQSNLQEVEEDE